MGFSRWPVDQIEYDRLRAWLEENLGEGTFAAHYQSGQAFSLEQALEAAAGV